MWYSEGTERSLPVWFNHCTVEVLFMRWLKRDIWKTGLALAGMLLLLVLRVWVPVSVAGAYEGTSGLATPVTGTVQATPTVDATVTALNKEKLEQEVQQLKNQNASDLFGWFRTNAAILFSTLAVVFGGLFGLWRWRVDRRDAQDKELKDRRDAQDKDLKAQAEERFKTAVTALGDEKESVQVGGAILLRSFLNKEDKEIYERYYTQIFDLAVAYLRLPRTPPSLEDPDGIPHSPEDLNAPLPLTTLRQALIVVFKEACPLARSQNKGSPQSLYATGIQLDNASLWKADLKQVWMPQASLREADLREAKLMEADLSKADLNGADLREAKLMEADLRETTLSGADLREADLREADLREADLRRANLSKANLSKASLIRADLREADLREADFSYSALDEADLREADLRRATLSSVVLCGANLSKANLIRADLRGAFLGSQPFFSLPAAYLHTADLHEADLSKAKLYEVDLREAKLGEAKLVEADLRGAFLSGADLRYALQLHLLFQQ
jgi:uncharacterized protein YjbI with pentapeptide repeats